MAAGVLIAVFWPLGGSASPAPKAAIASVGATDCSRRVIYHSPQKPGYTSWVGAWTMPDRSLMVGLTQATGPVDPSRRRKAPASLRRRLGVEKLPPTRDFWGLDVSARYLRSTDGGGRWSEVHSDRYRAAYPQGYAASATIALRDGTLLRRVNGYDLLHDRSVPHTAYLQRLRPGAVRWSSPQVLMNMRRYTYQLSRLRRLRDGRLVGTGQYWAVPAGSPHRELIASRAQHLLVVSEDEGRTWKRMPVQIPADRYVAVNEWDVAELPNGDLLAVFRTARSRTDRKAVSRQGRLARSGGGWRLTSVSDAPFPLTGHPDLLTTREGVVLHIGGTGVHWTASGGRSWKPLRFLSPDVAYGSEYYPASVQTRDGLIRVFGHIGSDDPYGARDQAVVMDTFRLVPSSSPYPGGPSDPSVPVGLPGSAEAFQACRAAVPEGGSDLRGSLGGR